MGRGRGQLTKGYLTDLREASGCSLSTKVIQRYTCQPLSADVFEGFFTSPVLFKDIADLTEIFAFSFSLLLP